jgi:hypothetical protein
LGLFQNPVGFETSSHIRKFHRKGAKGEEGRIAMSDLSAPITARTYVSAASFAREGLHLLTPHPSLFFAVAVKILHA